MEAARIPWRPLGRILVEQGLLTSEELETALEQQERSGKRLGETIVECGFVSGPELSSALASQYGIELKTETGFGTGLRGQIQRRHESERRGARPTLVESLSSDDDADFDEEFQPDEPETRSPEAGLLTQLEEQWAKLAAAEALLADQDQQLRVAALQRDRRRDQAVRLAHRARRRAAAPDHDQHEQAELHEHAERLAAEVRSRDEEIEHLGAQSRGLADRLAAAEASLAERVRESSGFASQLESRSHEVEEARGALYAAQTAIEAQERRFEELTAEFERVVHSRTEVEAALAERGRHVEKLHQDLSRRHDQARRFAARLRGARQQQISPDELATVHGELERAREAGAAADAALAEQNGRVDELRAELVHVVESRAEVEQALEAARATAEEREHDLGGLRAQLEKAAANEQGREEERSRLVGELEQTHTELRAAQTSAHEHERALDELHGELEQVRNALASTHMTAEEREHRQRAEADQLRSELNDAHALLADARATVNDREHDLEALRAELERTQATLVSATVTDARERALAEELEHLRVELRRTGDDLAAARADVEERERTVGELRGELEHAHAGMASAQGTVEERERSLQEDLAQLRRELDEAHAALTAAEGTVEERERALREDRDRLHSELDQSRETLTAVQTAADQRAGDLDEARDALDRRRAQAVRMTERLLRLRRVDEEQLSRIERLAADVRGCDEEIARLRLESEQVQELGARHDRARAQTRRFLERLRRRELELAELTANQDEPAAEPEVTSHLVFVELPDRYELVEREGPPPARNSTLELPQLDWRLIVAGARRSPLPDDERPCVVAQRANGVAQT